MSTPIPRLSRQRANGLFLSLFLGGMCLSYFVGNLWIGGTLSLGIALAVRQLVRERPFDAALSLICFLGVAQVAFPWVYVLAIPGAMTLFVREVLHIRKEAPQEAVAELQEEIEEEQHGQ